MTTRKKWQDPHISPDVCEEEWMVTAARAAAEVLGKTLSVKQFPKRLAEIREYRQSGEDGIWKVYAFQVYGLMVPEQTKPVPGEITEWLTASDFGSHQPISSTARYLIRQLDEKNLLPPWT